jgi:hypothetical protein
MIYSTAYNNADLRDIGQRGKGPNRNPWKRKATNSDIWLIEHSEKPLATIDIHCDDPVYNIAIQNPLAQPGGGAALVSKHRTDLADLFGIESNAAAVPNVHTASFQQAHNFNSYRYDSADNIQKRYYGAGWRPSGDIFVVPNCCDHDHRRFDREKRIKKHTRTNSLHDLFDDHNTIVFTGTALNPLSQPVGARSNFSFNFARTVDNNLPPKTVVSSTDKSTFVAY